MTDPLDVLRTPVRPVDPDPGFAADLRARVERALLAPERETMTTPTAPVRPTTTPVTALRMHTLTPYLAVQDAERAVEFYVAAFGAVRRGEPIVMPDGRTGHVEVAIGDSVLMLADEFPEIGLAAPVTRGGPSQSLRLEVADPDAVVAAALAAGAAPDRPVQDRPHGRGGSVLDPAGHRWMVERAEPRPGDLVHASLWTPDTDAAAAFYRDVLDRSGGTAPETWHTTGRPTLLPCWTVPDVDDAVDLVRAAGGSAREPADRPYGRVADCVDDQDLPFALCAPTGATEPPRGLAHYEVRVPDPVRARAFYSTVLGWRFRPGADPDSWHPSDGSRPPTPTCNLTSGDAAVVPWFRVADLDAAVTAVREAGGHAVADDVVVRCTDDQGTPFGLVR